MVPCFGGTKSAVSFIDVRMFCISQHSSIASKAAMDHALLRAAEPWVHTEGLCRGGMELLVSSGDPKKGSRGTHEAWPGCAAPLAPAPGLVAQSSMKSPCRPLVAFCLAGRSLWLSGSRGQHQSRTLLWGSR